MTEFGETTTADEVLDGIDLTGKVIVVTGGASGLGQETARAMAARGARMVIAARDQAKLDTAARAIAEGSGGGRVETALCDLANLASVRACAKEMRSRYDRIDILINNAGVMACPMMRTADGFEMQFGTNHLGHFLLTNLLMPLIEAGQDKRIVNLSSRGHHIAPVNLDDPNYENREYEPWQSYGESKTANILFAVGLEKRLTDKGIHASALHPGGIHTNLGRHLSEADMAALVKRITERAGGNPPKFKTIPQGAATTCYAAAADTMANKGGVYLEDCHIADVDDDAADSGVRSYAIDPAIADRLWALSEELVGETFAY